MAPQWRRSFRAYDTDVVSATAADTLSPTPPPPVTAAREAAPAAAHGERTSGKERGTLVKFTGRLGKDPFISAKRGVPHVRLPVGEHYEDADGTEQTRWHECGPPPRTATPSSSWRSRARSGGDVEVRVRGYRHERGPDSRGRPQRPFVRAFQIDLTRKPTPRRDTPGTGGGER